MGIETSRVEPWSPQGGILPAQIALAHLAVRQNQVRTGTNTFADILDTQLELNSLEQYYIETGGNFFVARTEDRRLAGFVGLCNDGGHYATLKRQAVLPEHQGWGYGTDLVNNLLIWAHQYGFRKIRLQTGGQETAKQSIYDKVGFVVTGTVPKPGKPDEFLMELDLQR